MIYNITPIVFDGVVFYLHTYGYCRHIDLILASPKIADSALIAGIAGGLFKIGKLDGAVDC